MMVQETTLKSHQDREMPVQIGGEGGAFSWRYAYGRSADARAMDRSSEDCMVIRHDQNAFVFAVCDGVSQSFFGGLAARIMADSLVDWLWKTNLLSAQVPDVCNEIATGEALENHLDALTGPASQEVSTAPIADDVPELLREVLEKSREEGSASNFVCGRIDRPSERIPDGRAVFAWLGDTRLRLWGPVGERTAELGDTFHTMERWSTRWGPIRPARLRTMPPTRVRPHVHVMPLVQFDQPVLIRLMAYSDGLKVLDSLSEPLTDIELDSLIMSVNESPLSDDITFFELSAIDMARMTTEGESLEPALLALEPLPAPEGLQVQQVRHKLRATWQPVARATSYQAEIVRDDIGFWQVRRVHGTTLESWSLPPGSYALRIRAIDEDRPGEWTATQELRMASHEIREIAGLVALVALCGTLALLAGMILQTKIAGGVMFRKPIATPSSPTPTATSTSTTTSVPTAEAAAAVARQVTSAFATGAHATSKATAVHLLTSKTYEQRADCEGFARTLE